MQDAVESHSEIVEKLIVLGGNLPHDGNLPLRQPLVERSHMVEHRAPKLGKFRGGEISPQQDRFGVGSLAVKLRERRPLRAEEPSVEEGPAQPPVFIELVHPLGTEID